MISTLAYIHPEAVIGANCEIGPFCYIDKNVVIGDNNKLMNGVTLPTPVFLPGEFQGLYSPWGHKESDMTERLSLFTFYQD